MPQVTFIIPAYNAADYLRQAVKSILDQTCSDWKLIIVDDGSTDATPAIADACAGSDARISVIHHPAPSGSAYLARLSAIKAATTEIISPLDADDLIPTDYLQRLLEIRQSTGAPLVYPLMYVSGAGRTFPMADPSAPYYGRPMKGREGFRLTLCGWKVTCNGGLIDRDLYLEAIGRLGDKRRDANADETLTRQLLLLAPEVVFSDVRYIYRVNEESVTRRRSLRRLEILQSAADVQSMAIASLPADSEEVRLARLNLLNTIFDAMEMVNKAGFNGGQRLDAIAMIERARSHVDIGLIKDMVNPLLRGIYSLPVAKGFHAINAYSRIRSMIKPLGFQLRRPARKFRHLRERHRHNMALRDEIGYLEQGRLAPGSESAEFYKKFYHAAPDSPSGSAPAPIVICPFDGKIYHGGTTDRIRGILSTFAEAERRGLPFRISWTSPFRLEDYLQPAAYDWRIAPEEISRVTGRALPVIIQDRDNRESARMLDAALNGIHRQLHIYSNADTYIGKYTPLYKRLFKPSPRLAKAVQTHKRVLGEHYWAFHFRFLCLLGDFKDWSHEILPESRAQELMARCRDEMLRMMRELPEGYRVFVTSDSRRFLDFVADADPRIYVTPGTIRNIDLSPHEEDDTWLKAFADQQLLMDARRVIRMVTTGMYKSGYSRFAAEVGGAEFIPHNF